jgi:predicted permease
MRRAFRLLAGRAGITRAVDDEIAFHIEMRTQQLIASGMTPDAAWAEALRQFGSIESVRQGCITLDEERVRAMRRANFLDELRQDVIYSIRALRRNLGFTAIAVTTLALGIGANTAIFTLIDALLLRPLPVPAPQQLIELGRPTATMAIFHSTEVTADLFTYPVYRELRERNRFVTGLLASGVTERLDVLVGHNAGEPEHPHGRFVSGNYFQVLRVPAAIGRTFDSSADAGVGTTPVVTISDGYWTRRFGKDPGVVGRSILIDGVPFTIIGVTAPGFFGEIVGEATDLWIPITMQPVMMPRAPRLTDRRLSWLLLLGRLAPGVSLPAAESGFRTLIPQLLADEVRADPLRTKAPRHLELFTGSGEKGFSRARRVYRVPLLTLMVGVVLVLLIICANVANLLLARAMARHQEMAVRLAIGAGRMRLIRQLLTESAVLALLAGGAGVLIAVWGSQLLLVLASDGGATIPLDLHPDLPMLLFTMGLSLATVVLFGLVPALRAARVDVAPVLRSQGRGTIGSGRPGRGRIPLGTALIAGQVALSLVLLIGASLLVRSLRSVENANPGLDRDHLLIVGVDVQARGYVGERRMTQIRELAARLAQLPGVAAVTFSELGLFNGSEGSTSVHIPGFSARHPEDTVVYFDAVGPDYVRAIGGRLLQGRDFTTSDAEGSAPVILINETMARFYFGHSNPIGRSAQFTDSALKPFSTEVVGVIADVKDHDLHAVPIRRFYTPYLQHPGDTPPPELRFEIRTVGDPAALVPQVRRAITTFDPLLPIDGIDPLTSLMRQSISQERLLARLASGFGTLALLMAAIGLYGVMTYAVNRRTGEIGLRVALGAAQGDIVRMVLGNALRVVATGVLVGVPFGLATTRLLRSQLHGIDATDPVSIAVALTVLAAAAVAASLLPALRAGRVAPLVALRQE